MKRPNLLLFLLCLFTYGYFYQASDHNVAVRIDLIRAIVERHTLWIENPYAGQNTADIVELGGHVYSSKAPGASFAGLIPWIIVTTLARVFGWTTGTAAYWRMVTYLVTLFSAGAVSSLAAVILYRLALHFELQHGDAIVLALILAFGTILFPYATEFAGEPFAACCELTSFYLLVIRSDSIGWSLLGGLLAGWGVLCDYPTFAIAVPIAGFAFYKLRAWPWALAAFVFGAAIVAALLAVYNSLAFGKPFFLSYEAFGVPGVNQARFPWQAEGFVGITRPHLAVLWDILLWPQRGLLFANPVFVLLPIALFYLAKSRWGPEASTVIAAICAMVLLCASCSDNIAAWGGGTATGPRHLTPVIPFMVLALAFLPRSYQWQLIALGAVSVALMLMATAVQPHFPYEYVNPWRDYIWPNFSDGNLALNTDSFFNYNSPSAGAFNLGQLLGLGKQLQLWPLLVVWIVVLPRLIS